MKTRIKIAVRYSYCLCDTQLESDNKEIRCDHLLPSMCRRRGNHFGGRCLSNMLDRTSVFGVQLMKPKNVDACTLL